MTLFLELDWPWQWRPGVYVHRAMVRAWWGPLAVGVLRAPFKEFATERWDWEAE